MHSAGHRSKYVDLRGVHALTLVCNDTCLRSSVELRSLHEADQFGLFSDPRDDDDEEDQEAKGGTEADRDDGDGDGRKPAAAVLPNNVKLMLDTMKITRLDKVRRVERGL